LVLTLCFSVVRSELHRIALNLGALISFVVGTKLLKENRTQVLLLMSIEVIKEICIGQKTHLSVA
jgi:hypothetical protein